MLSELLKSSDNLDGIGFDSVGDFGPFWVGGPGVVQKSARLRTCLFSSEARMSIHWGEDANWVFIPSVRKSEMVTGIIWPFLAKDWPH